MHALRIGALARAIGVRGEVRDTVGEDRGERVLERRIGVESHAQRRARGGAFPARQRIAALRLAACRGEQVEPLLEQQRELEQARWISRAQLELDLVDRRAAIARDDPAHVGVERPFALALAQHAVRAAELGAEHRDERLPAHDLEQARAQLRIGDPREIRLVAFDRSLELAALEQPARRRALALHGLDAPRATAPHAQTEVRRGEVVILGIEIHRLELLRDRAHRRQAAHQRVARQPPQVRGRRVELQLDLSVGVHATRVP